MYETTYIKAKSTSAAVKAVSEADDGKFLAGGMTLIPTMKQRLAAPDCLVDLAGCGLSGIAKSGDGVRVGAMTTHADIAASKVVQKAIPALAYLASHIGDAQVRNRGTLGGSVANNDPAACYPAAVLALGGTIHTSVRDIPAADFFTGLFETALAEDEIIEAISFPKPKGAGYAKFPNPASRYAMAGVFVARFADGVRLAITGAGEDGVFRHEGMEAALSADFSAKALDGVTITEDGLMGDIHASADYRANLVAEMARRAVSACSG
jgi:carbon-monoxide dehydrogenase medium subunit